MLWQRIVASFVDSTTIPVFDHNIFIFLLFSTRNNETLKIMKLSKKDKDYVLCFFFFLKKMFPWFRIDQELN